jgi:hypothetical protein
MIGRVSEVSARRSWLWIMIGIFNPGEIVLTGPIDGRFEALPGEMDLVVLGVNTFKTPV